MDSTNIKMDDWGNMVKIIKANYEKFDGFVVIHGTDTMTYSCSALAFMLKGLGKAVVFTGKWSESILEMCTVVGDQSIASVKMNSTSK